MSRILFALVFIQVAEAVDVAEVDHDLTIEILSECGLTSVLTVSKGTKSVGCKRNEHSEHSGTFIWREGGGECI